MKNLFRLYIDESGNHNYSKFDELGKRYLGLTGIIIDSEAYENDLQPRVKSIKKIFSNDPDEEVIFHREDIINKRGYFSKLKDLEIEKEFNKQFISLLKEVDYYICCVVIDKKVHLEKYGKAAEHPYHYCLRSMLERYTHFLEPRGKGDVYAESRGREEDMALKSVYEKFYNNGTYFRTPEYVQMYLTSREIKIKQKIRCVEGLELADSLALPTKLDVLKTYNVLDQLTENFTKTMINSIQKKYCRGNNSTKIKGYGKKML